MVTDFKDLRLVIFDFDGTLGDTRANIVLTMRQTLERLGYAQPDEDTIAATIGVPLEKGFEQMLPGISPDDVVLCARTYREIFETNRKVLVPKLFPHVKETLEALKRAGLVLTVASSRSSKSLNEFLRDMDIAPYVSYVLGADNVTHAKPHPSTHHRTRVPFVSCRRLQGIKRTFLRIRITNDVHLGFLGQCFL